MSKTDHPPGQGKLLDINPDIKNPTFHWADLYYAYEDRNFNHRVWLDAAKCLDGIRVSPAIIADLLLAVNYFMHKFEGAALATDYRGKPLSLEALEEDAARRIYAAVASKKTKNDDGTFHTFFGPDAHNPQIFTYLPQPSSPLRSLIYQRLETLRSEDQPNPILSIHEDVANLISTNWDLTDDIIIKCIYCMALSIECELTHNWVTDALEQEEKHEQIAALTDLASEFMTPGSIKNIRTKLAEIYGGDPDDGAWDVRFFIYDSFGVDKEKLLGDLSGIQVRLIKPIASPASAPAKTAEDEITQKLTALKKLLDRELISLEDYHLQKTAILNSL